VRKFGKFGGFMKKLVSCVLGLLSLSAFAGSLDVKVGDVYQGLEEINEHSTGRDCTVTVNALTKAQKGLHCYDVSLNIIHTGLKLVSDLKLQSSITNYHRSEYPALKTCALTQDGSTSSDEIYSSDTTNLVSSIFSGMHKERSTQYDYFMRISKSTKAPLETRVHVMKPLLEKNIDCVNLQLKARID
jgi:hypothetical protein